jgi:hypothetical protein
MKMRPTLVRAMPAGTEVAGTEAAVSDRKPRFPAASLLLLAAALIVLFVIAGWARSHCAFGFGGFGCTGVFVGRGEMLVAATLALTAAVVALIPVSGWRLVRWWRGRQA